MIERTPKGLEMNGPSLYSCYMVRRKKEKQSVVES